MNVDKNSKTSNHSNLSDYRETSLSYPLNQQNITTNPSRTNNNNIYIRNNNNLDTLDNSSSTQKFSYKANSVDNIFTSTNNSNNTLSLVNKNTTSIHSSNFLNRTSSYHNNFSAAQHINSESTVKPYSLNEQNTNKGKRALVDEENNLYLTSLAGFNNNSQSSISSSSSQTKKVKIESIVNTTSLEKKYPKSSSTYDNLSDYKINNNDNTLNRKNNTLTPLSFVNTYPSSSSRFKSSQFKYSSNYSYSTKNFSSSSHLSANTSTSGFSNHSISSYSSNTNTPSTKSLSYSNYSYISSQSSISSHRRPFESSTISFQSKYLLSKTQTSQFPSHSQFPSSSQSHQQISSSPSNIRSSTHQNQPLIHQSTIPTSYQSFSNSMVPSVQSTSSRNTSMEYVTNGESVQPSTNMKRKSLSKMSIDNITNNEEECPITKDSKTSVTQETYLHPNTNTANNTRTTSITLSQSPSSYTSDSEVVPGKSSNPSLNPSSPSRVKNAITPNPEDHPSQNLPTTTAAMMNMTTTISNANKNTNAPSLGKKLNNYAQPATTNSKPPKNTSSCIYLPKNFYEVEMNHLIYLIAEMLEKLTKYNDQITLTKENLTRFHSRKAPDISIYDYLKRIVKYAAIDKVALLSLLIYIDRICKRHRMFTISSLTVHRFIITSLTCASKAMCDSICTNTHYSKVGGIPIKELNLLELEFLFLIDWHLACTDVSELQQYYVNLVRQSSIYHIMPDPETNIKYSDTENQNQTQTQNQSQSSDQPQGEYQSNPPPSSNASRSQGLQDVD